MPRAFDLSTRQQIVALTQLGLSSTHIAQRLRLSPRSVRRLRARHATRPGPDGLRPDYTRCGRRRSPPLQSLYHAVAELRRQHRRWGAGRLRLQLRAQNPGVAVPGVRTLQRWLKQQHLAPQPTVVKRPSPDHSRAGHPHDVWQTDAAEHQRLLSGVEVCWLRITDECSGAVLQTVLFPPGPLVGGIAGGGAGGTAAGVQPLGAATAFACR